MAALTAAKPYVQLGLDEQPFTRAAPVATNAIIFHGAMVGKDTNGYWNNATTAIAALGLAELETWDDQSRTGQSAVASDFRGNKVDNTGGADGAREIVVRHGVFKMLNKAGDLVTTALIGANVSVEDNQTVRATAAGSVVAGKLWGFADDGLPLVELKG